MSRAVDVLALLRDPHYDLRPADDFDAAADAVDDLVDAAREHMLASARVQAEKPGTYAHEKAVDSLNGGAYYRLRAALARIGGGAA